MDLSGAQFGNYAMTRTTREDHGDSREYNLYHQDGDRYGPSTNVGTATVSHVPARSRTYIPDDHDVPWHQAAGWRGEEQAPLFEHQSTRGHDELAYISVAKEHRHMAPTIIGVAARDAAEHTGAEIAPDNSLSPHSQRMLGHLQQLGAAGAHSFSDNDLDFREAAKVGYSGGLEGLHQYVGSHQDVLNGEQFIPVSEVRSGQRAMRSLLPRHRRAAAEPEQGTLF